MNTPTGPVVIRKVTTPEDLARCLDLRRVVFIDEQGVPEHEELDDLDPVCTHLLALGGGEPVGTARLRDPGGDAAKAQRVAVLRAWRGAGVGRALMRALEEEARAMGKSEVVLGAQITAIPFYERLGYAAEGDPFDDAGIPHRWMRRRIVAPGPRGAARSG